MMSLEKRSAKSKSKPKQPMHQKVDPMSPSSEEIKLAVEGKILKRLGKPPSFFKIEAKHLWANKWRVNVWSKGVGSDDGVVPSFEITDSFFVEVSKTNRVSASPKIVKKY